MQKLTLTLCFLLMASSAHAMVTDWPHNETSNIGCTDCHSYSLWWEFSPSNNQQDPVLHRGLVGAICVKCHFDGASDPYVVGHTSINMGGLHNPLLGDWGKGCTDCHDPHFQAQLNWTVGFSDNLFLVKGDIQPSSIQVTGDGSAGDPYISRFVFTNLTAGLNSDWNTVSTWMDNPDEWVRKSGRDNRGLIVAVPTPTSGSTYEIIAVNTQLNELQVKGKIDTSYNSTGTSFGLLYGQLIRDNVDGKDVKLFNPKLAYDAGEIGGYADRNNNEGLCQVCHTATKYWTFDDQCRDGNGSVNPCEIDTVPYSPTSHNSSSSCTDCHLHGRGFAPGSDRGKHTAHNAAGYKCQACHGTNSPPMMADGLDMATTTVCANCHNDGKWIYDGLGAPIAPGPPNILDYKENWENDNYYFGCFGCHKGRPDNADDIGSDLCDPLRSCQECHSKAKDPVNICIGSDCASCHVGDGSITGLPVVDDLQRSSIGMKSAGHRRLVSTEWIRHYPCYYCHTDTVDKSGNLLNNGKHLNSYDIPTMAQNDTSINVAIDLEWDVSGHPDPYYTDENHPPSALEDADSCYNTYCHSDGTTVAPVMKSYPWDGGSRECNACHSHDLSESACDICHEDRQWAPEDKWLSAMPMYSNTDDQGNPLTGTAGANSHFRHLFTGYSCDDCHADTVVGACRDCHGNEAPTGIMTEEQHVYPDKHVDGFKTVKFKQGGTYNISGDKSCSNTACHTGYAPQWGGSVLDSVTCKACHGTDGGDVDNFGSFDGVRAKINLSEWETTGHGRPAASGNYDSGNPPANFPENGCWYCHDSTVLHQNEDRPFRLLQHDQFKQRFEKECVFCHMTESEAECLGCHDSVESLAPQLGEIGAIAVINQPYTIEQPDHSGFTGGCMNGGCHINDQTRHNTGAGTWSQDQKNDVRNSYIQVGVCLKCHDDDNKSADESYSHCYTCHAKPVDDPGTPDLDESLKYELGFDPKLPGTRRITPQKAKASSFHFGHKHYSAYINSLTVQSEIGVASNAVPDDYKLVDTNKVKDWLTNQWYGYYLKMTSGGTNTGEVRMIISNTKDTLIVEPNFPAPIQAGNNYEIMVEAGSLTATPVVNTELTETGKHWSDDQWRGYSIIMADGPGSGEVRRISTNSSDTLTLATPFAGAVEAGNAYTIILPVWKGGKFCWDCHDPHGDKNIYMIQDKVATRTDGFVGQPITRATVSFTDKNHLGLSYAKMNEPYDGICNVCHTEGSQHYAIDRGDGHNAGRLCTECHEHRFTDSHSDNQPCNTCHGERPIPRHSGFGLPRDCTKCHKGVIQNRMNIMGQFTANSHHVQGIEVTNKHCYKCHWEADEFGLINRDHHQGFNNKTFQGESGREVDLVIWNSTTRPTDYILGETATQFLASNMAVGQAEERAEVESITPHCLGCHSDLNSNTEPFGDCKTPRKYAWDGSSVADRYLDTGVTTWGKYTDSADAAQKNITKAFSAHGNAVNNGGGFSETTGVDGVIPNTRAGQKYNIQCFDCHNSHGSKVGGVTSSYYSFKGDQNGANLKETQAGKGGYAMSYMASSYTNPQSVNYYEAGAGQCFDCHETHTAGTTPWGYNSTFDEDAPIMGYADTLRFGQGVRGVASRYPYKSSTIIGGHMKASSSITTTPQRQISGLCTPCHDPHGVSKSLGSDRAYGVPLLKGTWMTSPYKEDAALAGATTGRRENLAGTQYNDPSLPREDGPEPLPAVHTDQKTFGTDRVKETDQTFAGLCLSCHSKNSLTNGVNNDGPWKSLDRVHESVRGWGDNEMHSYTCSKCHRPHNSTLPRLLKTNCLNTEHRGQVAFGGMPGSNDGVSIPEWTKGGIIQKYYGSFPYGKADERATGSFGNFEVNCHPTGTWPDNSWNEVSPW